MRSAPQSTHRALTSLLRGCISLLDSHCTESLQSGEKDEKQSGSCGEITEWERLKKEICEEQVKKKRLGAASRTEACNKL